MMEYNKEEALQRLAETASTSTSTSKAGRVRDVFDEIEYAQACGARLKEVLRVLDKLDFGLSEDGLKIYLHRIRGERGANKKTMSVGLSR